MGPVPSSVSLPEFRALLEGSGADAIEGHDSAVYGLLPGLTLGYLNPAWFRFAQANGGESMLERWGLGADVLMATSGLARILYQKHFRRCLERGQTWRHDYECSSDELYREFHMEVRPLGVGRGLLVLNTLLVEQQHGSERVALEPIEALYVGGDGLIRQCAFCRRVLRARDPARWDWVPEWVKHAPSNLTGGLCKSCHHLHFSGSPESA